MSEETQAPTERFVLSQAQRDEIAQKLRSKVTRWMCPMCGHTQWDLLDGYFNLFVSPSQSEIQLGGINIPSTAILCKNCGHISFHALGALGLLNRG